MMNDLLKSCYDLQDISTKVWNSRSTQNDVYKVAIVSRRRGQVVPQRGKSVAMLPLTLLFIH